MFHRPRPSFPLRPPEATPSDPTADATPTTSMTEPNTESPVSNPQPSTTKDQEAMSTTYPTNPMYTPDTTDTATAQMPSTQPFTPQGRGMVRAPYAYNSGMATPEQPAVSTGRKLVIGEGITMSGEIEACDHLVVEGTVEASLKGASVLDVSQSGMFFGAVEINEATIAGRFEGDLVVNGRLTVRATGSVVGTLSYKELAVEAGATIEGKMSPLSSTRVATMEKKATPAKIKAPSMPTNNAEAANELPLAGSKVAAA